MGILDQLISVSEELARQAQQRVLDQRAVIERLERRGDTQAADRARLWLASFEHAYRVATYRLKTDCAVSKRANPMTAKVIPVIDD